MIKPTLSPINFASADFVATSLWDGGFSGYITVTNNGNYTIENWQIKFKFDGNVTSASNGVNLGVDENGFTNVKSVDWNSAIQPGGTATVYLNGEGEGTFTATDLAVFSRNYDVDNDGAITEPVVYETEITLNNSELTFDENKNEYIVSEPVIKLFGSVTSTDNRRQYIFKRLVKRLYDIR